MRISQSAIEKIVYQKPVTTIRYIQYCKRTLPAHIYM
jgi:hypothetical protein